MNLNEITSWTDEELADASNILDKEKSRRYTLKSAEKQMNNLMWEYSTAIGRRAGDPWTQPVGAHDAYPEGIVVSHSGKEWRSLISGNVWEPGVSGWREEVDPVTGEPPEYLPPTGAHGAYRTGDVVSFRGKQYVSLIDSNVYSPEEYPRGWEEIIEGDTPDDADIPEYVQPTGAHDAYSIGDRVLFEGVIYESLSNGNVYSPTDYPGGWALVSEEGTPEPEPEPVPVQEPELWPEPVPEPKPEPEPAPAAPDVPEWVQPTGGHDAYAVGDRVLFEGEVYESVIPGNTWSPTGYPAGWKKI